MEIVKKLTGFSGSNVFLVRCPVRGLFIKKIGAVSRNIERISALERLNYPVCKILSSSENELDLEYIHGLDISTYLTHNGPKKLIDFLINILKRFAIQGSIKNFTKDIIKNTEWIDTDTELPFTQKQLFQDEFLIVPSSVYHGDLTFENILYSNDSFYLIDAVTTIYDSYVFDIAKLRQDLDCKWFLRRSYSSIDVKLYSIKKALLEEFPEANNDIFLILMLLRVYNYTLPGSYERDFILKEIKRLWK